uniref:Small ribosomal subunit protein bS6m n=1 Tax=Setaria digitata TaxID=48799 RepID=A0A915PK11_9BILA
MPFYEITLITRSLAKPELFTTIHRAAKVLLDNGAIIEKLESLGHRDLPFRRVRKQTDEHIYTSNYFLIKAFMPRDVRDTTNTILRNDLDLIHVMYMHEKPRESITCNLEELLKPPPERKSVKALRDNQKLGHYSRQMIYKRTEKEWKAIPKSYPIADAEIIGRPKPQKYE